MYYNDIDSQKPAVLGCFDKKSQGRSDGEGTVAIAAPELRHVTDLVIDVEAPVSVGESVRGLRRLVVIAGGTAQGSRLSGRVLPGVDSQIIRNDGVTELQARYVIETQAGARIHVENNGLRSGPPEVMAALHRGEPVDPGAVYFRAAPRFETGDPAHAWLMSRLFISAGIRRPATVELAIFEVL
jgi:hypothetical protein